MEIHFTSKLEEYYRKFVELQEKLKQSEEQRFLLEMKFNEMVQVAKEEEQAHYKKLRSQYKRFLEEDKKRQDRNERIIRNLERVETRIATLSAKTERINILRRQYQNFLLGIPHRRQESGISRERSFIREEPLLEQQNALFRDDFSLRKPKDNINLQKPLFDQLTLKEALEKNKSTEERIEILDRYLQSISSDRCRDLLGKDLDIGGKASLSSQREVSREEDEPTTNHATAIADGIMNSIYSRYYNKVDVPRNDEKPNDKELKQDNSSRKNDIELTQITEIFKSKDNHSETVKMLQKEEKEVLVEIEPQKDYSEANIKLKDTLENHFVDVINPNKIDLDVNKITVEQPDSLKPNENEQEILLQPQKESKNTFEAKEDTSDYSKKDSELLECATDIKICEPVHMPEPAILNAQPQYQIDENIQLINESNTCETKVSQDNVNEKIILNQDTKEVDDQKNVTRYDIQHNVDAKIEKEKDEHSNINIFEEDNFQENVLPANMENDHLRQYDVDTEQQKNNNELSSNDLDSNGVDCQGSGENNHQEIQHIEPDSSEFNNEQNEIKTYEFNQEEDSYPKFDDKHQEFNKQVAGNNQNALNNVEQSQIYSTHNSHLESQFEYNEQPLEYDQAYSQQYDENGQAIQYNQNYDQYGQPLLYDQNGQIVQPQYDENGQIIPQYDENGQLIMLYDETGQSLYDQGEQLYSDQNPEAYDQNQFDEYQEENQGYSVEPEEHQSQIQKASSLVSTNADADGNDEKAVELPLKDEEDIEKVKANNLEGTEKVDNVMDILNTDTESTKQDTSKISNDTDFDFS